MPEEVLVQLFTDSVEEMLGPFITILTLIIDIAAGLIIGISVILAFVSYLKVLKKDTKEQTMEKETIRLRLARGILLALDFEIGSDVLKTVLVPSVTDLTILSVVVGIRIILSWSLSKEIDRHTEDIKETKKDTDFNSTLKKE